MSLRDRLRAVARRRLGTGRSQRLALFGAAAAMLVAFTATIAILAPAPRPSTEAPRTASAPVPTAPPTSRPIRDELGRPVSGLAPPDLERAARRFFGSYLRFHYDQGPLRIRSATPSVTAEIKRRGQNTALRGRHPRIRAVRARVTGPGYRVIVQVTDGGVGGPYALSADFERRDARWQAARLTPVE